MDRPVVSAAAEELYEFLEAFVVEDEEDETWQTLLFCEALMGGTAQIVWNWVTDRTDMLGWAYLFNADLADTNALPWLAQFNGTKLRDDMSEQEQRDAIRTPAGFSRGTLAYITEAPKQYLTGTRAVYVREREGGAYRLHMRTLLWETPNEASVLAAILLQKPAGILLDYDVIIGQDWIDLMADHASWNAVMADYATWDEVRSDIP